MANRLKTAIHSCFANRAKFAFAALMALSFLFAQSLATTALADKRPKDFGRVKIFVPIHDPVKNPDGYQILVDGKDYGTTTSIQRTLQLSSGQAHTIEIIFPDNKRWTRDIFINAGRIYCIGVEYAPFTPPLEVPCPPCSVGLETSSNVKQGDPVTVNANIDFKGPMDNVTYTWTVSPGSARILSGGGPSDRTVTLDTTGIGERELQVNLAVDTGSFSSDQKKCNCEKAMASVIVDYEPEPERFQFVAFDDLKARLDNLVIDAQSKPDATAYVIYYSGDRCPAGQASRLGERSRDYLINTRGFNASRLVVIDGGKSAIDWVELYVVPIGGNAPTPNPGAAPAVRADLSQYPCITDVTSQPQTPRRPSRRRR